MMNTIIDNLNIITWIFIIVSAIILLLMVVSYFRKKKIHIVFKAGFILFILGTLVLVDMLWIEPNWLQTEQVVIHDSELAQVLEGIRVVQISDIHLRGGIGARERDLIAQVNALKPDLLFITGDFFSDKQKLELATEVKALVDLIRSLKTTAGIFGVQGNYDHPLNNPTIMKEFRAAGIDILSNTNRSVSFPNRKTLYLAGFDDSQNKYANLYAFRGIPAGAPVILLAHDPENFVEAIAAGVNLLLVGHTHGGQIGIPYIINRSNYANKSSFMGGLFDAGKTKMYVNRGIGTTWIPVRFFNRPEITVFAIRKDSE